MQHGQKYNHVYTCAGGFDESVVSRCMVVLSPDFFFGHLLKLKAAP